MRHLVERTEFERYLEARVSAARLVYNETGKLAVKQSLETAERQLEEYHYGTYTARQVLPTKS